MHRARIQFLRLGAKPEAAYLIILLSAAPLGAAELAFKLAPGSPVKLPNGGHTFAIGDVNGDGTPDLLVSADASLTAMLGDGRGDFAPAAGGAVKLVHGAGETVVGDFNRDGKLDWAGAHHDHYDVVVMLGNGRGDFAAAAGSPFTARAPGKKPHTHGLAVGDVNGDGKLDLVTANNEDDDVSVLLGDGAGRFSPARGSPFSVGRSPYPIALADVNRDQKLDVVAPNSAPGVHTVAVLLGDGSGALRSAPASPFRTAGAAYFVAVGDINRDGRPDLITTHNGDSRATILEQRQTGAFEPADSSPLELGGRAWGVIAVDLNRDEAIDLAAARGDAVAFFLGDGHGGFRPGTRSPITVGRGTWRLGAADLNADGKLDIVAGNVESDDIAVLLAQ